MSSLLYGERHRGICPNGHFAIEHIMVVCSGDHHRWCQFPNCGNELEWSVIPPPPEETP